MEAEVTIPEGVEVKITGKALEVKGPLGVLSKDYSFMPLVSFTKSGDKVVVKTPRDRKNDKKFLNTAKSHVQNMMVGVTKGYKYRLEMFHVHFPMRLTVQGDEIILSNFLGSKTDRKTKKYPEIKVQVKGKDVLIEGMDKERVGIVAARIEQLAKVKNHDRRVFKDGLFLVERGNINE